MTYPNDKSEIAGWQILPTEVRACTHWSLRAIVRPRREQQLLVVCQNSVPDVGAPHGPLQLVRRPQESNLESSRKGERLASGQMPTCADL